MIHLKCPIYFLGGICGTIHPEQNRHPTCGVCGNNLTSLTSPCDNYSHSITGNTRD